MRGLRFHQDRPKPPWSVVVVALFLLSLVVAIPIPVWMAGTGLTRSVLRLPLPTLVLFYIAMLVIAISVLYVAVFRACRVAQRLITVAGVLCLTPAALYCTWAIAIIVRSNSPTSMYPLGLAAFWGVIAAACGYLTWKLRRWERQLDVEDLFVGMQ